MTSLFKKLNLPKVDTILVLGAPDSFAEELDQLDDVNVLCKASAKTKVTFSIGFAITTAQRDAVSRKLCAAADGDAIVWLAYPKKSSKNYDCEFNRDSGWDVMGEAGFEGVRQVAIDEDWSALRFRRTENIKTMRRNPKMAISKEGKRRTK